MLRRMLGALYLGLMSNVLDLPRLCICFPCCLSFLAAIPLPLLFKLLLVFNAKIIWTTGMNAVTPITQLHFHSVI
jgi:hypothetical protein